MAKPLIQIALDSLDFDQTVGLATLVAPHVDIFEIGTPCIKHNGINLVKELRARFPEKLLLVDLKTMEAGEYETTPFYAAGADICTVLGVSGLATCAGVIKAANAFGASAQIDLINVDDKVACARATAEMGAHIMGIHTGLDVQAAGHTPFADLSDIARLGLNVRISVAGGIKPSTVQDVVRAGANIIVVGAAIYGAASPADAAREICELAEACGSLGGDHTPETNIPHSTISVNAKMDSKKKDSSNGVARYLAYGNSPNDADSPMTGIEKYLSKQRAGTRTGIGDRVEVAFSDSVGAFEPKSHSKPKIDKQKDTTRYVSAGIEDDEWPLAIGKKYRFFVALGAKREGVLGTLPEIDWGSRTELELLVVVHGDGLRFSPQTQKVTLYKSTKEKEVSTAYFNVEPLQTGLRNAWIMIRLAREMTLLQEYRLTLEVSENQTEITP